MGQAYSVEMKVKLKDENAATKILKDLWQKDFGDRYLNENLETFDDLIRFLLAEHQNMFRHNYKDGWHLYDSDFNASYSWEFLLDEWFEAIEPHLEIGSKIGVWPNSGYWENEVS